MISLIESSVNESARNWYGKNSDKQGDHFEQLVNDADAQVGPANTLWEFALDLNNFQTKGSYYE